MTEEETHQQRLVALGTLAASVAHEVNNVMTPAAGWAKSGRRALDEGDLDKARRAFDKCLHAAQRAGELCETILGYARPTEVGADLWAVVRSAVETLPRPPADEGIDLDIDVPGDLRTAANAAVVEHVTLNLLLNARRAVLGVRPNRRRIRIVAGERDGHIELVVSDGGDGVPADLLPRLFEPFSRGPNGGSGLGLATCRQMLERVGGSIDVLTAPNAGTAFTVRLPLVDAAGPRLAA